MKFMKPLALAGILVIGALGFIACSDDDDDPSNEGAETSVCASLTELQTAYRAVGTISAESTVEDVEAVRTDINDAWDDVAEAGADLEDARIDDLEAAYDDLADTLDGIDDDTTLAAAQADIQTQVGAVDTAWEEYYSSANCT